MTALTSTAPDPLTSTEGMLDLGAITPPILVFGGPYSNLQATAALRTTANQLGIPPHRTLCTGDVVAYGGDPEETTALIREWGVHLVRGNCEESLAAAADTCGCGFAADSACDMMSRIWYGFALNALSQSSRDWMASLPARITLDLAGIRVAALHGSVADTSRFIFASTPAAEKHADLDHLNADMVIAGHSGIPFTHALDGRLWHNAGVIGQPANDGTPDAWYSLINVVDGEMHVQHCRLSYDHRSAAATMRNRGLPEAYAKALVTGTWPSCEVLPPLEAAASGKALDLDCAPLVFRMKAGDDGATALIPEAAVIVA